MADATDQRKPTERLAELIERQEAPAVQAFLASLGGLDTVRAVSHLAEDDLVALLELVEAPTAAELLERLPDDQATGVFEIIQPATAARILEEMPSDAQADYIGELEDDEARAILAELEPEEAREIRELCEYDEESAGGLMITEYVEVRSGRSIGQVIDDLQAGAEEYRSYYIQYVYVVDRKGRLVGVLPFREIVLAPRSAIVDDLMISDPVSISADTPLDELEHFISQQRFFGVPVVDARGVLVGVLRRRSVEEAVSDRSDETFRAVAGIVGGEELRSMPLRLRAGRRLSWLSANIVLNVLAASVIAANQDTLEAVIALAVFLPIISDMSGCSGNQAVAVSLRELTLGVLRPADYGRVLLKELGVGLINGCALGLLVGLTAFLWKGNVWLGLVVGLALALNTCVAVVVGGIVPLVLKAFGRDPALASGPILTTVTDMCGFLLVLSLASALLERLI